MALAAWYWESPWPVTLGTAYVALIAPDIARNAARHSRLLWALTRPARPMRLHWSFWVALTEWAWDTVRVPADKRAGLQQLLGEYKPPGLTTYLFEGHPTPVWCTAIFSVRNRAFPT